MARLRPARTCRTPNSQAWSRYSLKKPRKNYVRALPRTSLLIFNMGADNPSYDLTMTMSPEQDIQLRSNSLEAARQVANKLLEKEIPQGYFFKILVYPHQVIREHKMATGAGADRISQGMSLSFGRAISVAARIRHDKPIFMIRSAQANRRLIKHAFRRAATKLSGTYKIAAQ